MEVSYYPELFTYSNEEPLKIVGALRAKICSKNNPNKKIIANFYAVDGATVSLIGFNTAKKLGVLMVGDDAIQAMKARTIDVADVRHEVMYNNQIWNSNEVVTPYPTIPGAELRLDIDYSIPPKFRNFSIIPVEFDTAARLELRTLLANGIIEPCSFIPGSSWVSPGLVIGKKNGEARFCIDMSAANRAIRRHFSYKMPTLTEMQQAARGKKFFSKLDIAKAFHHIELHEESRHITTFKTPYGYFRFRRMPFGLNVAPEYFQSIVESRLEGIPNVKVYIDDILIMSETIEELHEIVNQVRKRLQLNNFTINEDKVELDQTSIDFLGFRISGEGVEVTDERVKAIMSMKEPSSFTHLKSFLGKVNFLNSFIPRLAHVSKPLWEAAKDKKSFKWGPEQKSAFQEVKELIMANRHKCHFEQDLKTYLITDASEVAVAALLYQIEIDEHGKERVKVIEFASRLLSKVQSRYPQFQLELLGIVTGVKHFRHYLRLVEEFTIFTDLQTAQLIINKFTCGHKREMSRHDRWLLELSEFNYIIKHIPGKLNVADSLSRLATESTMEDIDPEHTPEELQPDYYSRTWTKEKKAQVNRVCSICTSVNEVGDVFFLSCNEVKTVAERDAEMMKIKSAVAKETEFDSFWRPKSAFIWCDDQGLLRYGTLIILPKQLRLKAIMIAHRTHYGAESTYLLLKEYVYWPGMKQQTEAYVASCEDCKLIHPQHTEVPMKAVEMPEFEWQHLAIDFYEAPSIKAKLISVIDYLTRKVVIEPIASVKAETTIEKLETIFSRIGYPSKIRSDNGSPFQSMEFKEWIVKKGILLEHSAPGHPQANGAVERTMKGINRILRYCVLRGITNWQSYVQLHAQYHNAKPNRATNVSPNLALEGRLHDIGLPLAKSASIKPCNMQILKDFEAAKKAKAKEYSDKVHRARNCNVTVGDTVWIRRDQKVNKLQHDYLDRKFEVVSRIGNDVTLKDVENDQIFKRNLSDCLRCPTNTREERRIEIWNSIAQYNALADKTLPGEMESQQQLQQVVAREADLEIIEEGQDSHLSSRMKEQPLQHITDETKEQMTQDSEFNQLCRALNRPKQPNDSISDIDGIPLHFFPSDQQSAEIMGAEKEVNDLIDRQISSEMTGRVKRKAAVKSDLKRKEQIEKRLLFVNFIHAQTRDQMRFQ